MIQPTYKQQFDKITEAYIKGEIRPFDAKFCFCGTLANGYYWNNDPDYGINDFEQMEEALLRSFEPIGLEYTGLRNAHVAAGGFLDDLSKHPLFEEYLFKGMCNALEVLKKIHISRGEVIDEAPVFIQRHPA